MTLVNLFEKLLVFDRNTWNYKMSANLFLSKMMGVLLFHEWPWE